MAADEPVDDPGETARSPAAVERERRDRGAPFARATVVRREPPVSATVGDRAVITPEGEVIGWVGGVECAQSVVVREARAALRSGEARLIGLAPDPDWVARPGVDAFEMTCHSGGTLEVFIEPVLPAPQLVIVGGSAIGRSIARLAGDLSFDVVLVDPDASDVAADLVVTETDPTAIVDAVQPGAFVVVASLGAFDDRGVAAGFQLEAAYIGLIASDRRAATVIEHAAELIGTDETTVADHVTTPAGLDIDAETPVEIALSVLAEVIAIRRESSSGTAAPAVDRAESKQGTDPVCGMAVPRDNSGATVDHDGTTYYFCSAGCADTFAASPEAYLSDVRGD